MSSNSEQTNKELLNIEIAVALDQGISIFEVAEMFGVTIATVKAISKKTDSVKLQHVKSKVTRFSKAEREILVERIGTGEELEEVAAEAGITESTLRRWCKSFGLTIARNIGQISIAEQREIKDLLEEQDWREIAHAYNISQHAIEKIKEPAHINLDTETLSYLFELLREKPRVSSTILSRIAKDAGLEISENAVSSYRTRLKFLEVI